MFFDGDSLSSEEEYEDEAPLFVEESVFDGRPGANVGLEGAKTESIALRGSPARMPTAQHELELERRADVKVIEGPYQVRVHIIEARELQSTDADNSADPFVVVEALGQRRVTKHSASGTNVVIDESFTFELPAMTKSELDRGTVRVTVYDRKWVGASKVGSFSTDIMRIYYRPDHELYRKWVGLANVESPGQDGIRGLLLLSIAIVGPRDVPKVHNRAKERLLELQLLSEARLAGPDVSPVLAPSMKRHLRFLVVAVHKAENLPPMDFSIWGGKASGIDPMVSVKFGDHPRVFTGVGEISPADQPFDRSKKLFRLNARFQTRLWIPYYAPSASDAIHIQVWDQDTFPKPAPALSDADLGLLDLGYFDRRQLVATGRVLSLKKVPDSRQREAQEKAEDGGAPRPYPHLFWLNLYGGPVPLTTEIESRASLRMALNPDTGSAYRGRVLISLADVGPYDRFRSNGTLRAQGDQVRPGKGKKRERVYRQNNIAELPSPTEKTVLFRAAVHSAELPSGDSFCVALAWGPLGAERPELRTGQWVAGGGGFAEINALLPVPRWDEEVVLPSRDAADGIPDLFVYLVRRTNGRRCAFARIAGDAVLKADINRPQWYNLKACEVEGSLARGRSRVGSVLLGLSASEHGVEIEPKWPVSTRCWLLVHVLQAQDLPPSDPNGQVDAFVRLSLAGSSGRTDRVMKSRCPVFNATCVLDAKLPADADLMPRLHLEVLDEDLFGDELVAEKDLSLRGDLRVENLDYTAIAYDGTRARPPAPPRPRWQTLASGGRVLMSATLVHNVPIDEPVLTVPAGACAPLGCATTVEIFLIGATGLHAGGVDLFSAGPPTIELRIGDVEVTVDALDASSDASNPTFLRREVLSLDLPRDASLLPAVQVELRSSVLGGLRRPVVGAAQIPLKPKAERTTGTDGLERDNPDFRRTGSEPASANPFRTNARIGDDRRYSSDGQRHRSAAEGAGRLTAEFERQVLEEELERKTGALPWDRAIVERCDPGHGVRAVGSLTYIARVHRGNPADASALLLPRQFSAALALGSKRRGADRALHVRLYVLRGELSVESDANHGNPDPYLRVSCGAEVVSRRAHALTDTKQPAFYERFDFTVALPVLPRLLVEVLDRDAFDDDLIGATAIELGDRWYSDAWQSLAPKPVELRRLWVPEAGGPRGHLRLWVEILRGEEARRTPPLDISPPRPAPWEARVIIYDAELSMSEVPGDMVTGMVDLFFRCRLGTSEWQDTDTHLRIRRGRGSFNWRMKFPLELPAPPERVLPRLEIVAWDSDLVAEGNALAHIDVTNLNLSHHLELALRSGRRYRCFQEESTNALGRVLSEEEKGLLSGTSDGSAGYGAMSRASQVPPERRRNTLWNRLTATLRGGERCPPDTKRLPLKTWDAEAGLHREVGWVRVSIELLPQAAADSYPAGAGRSEPNAHPMLMPPVGRPDFAKMWDPFYVCQVFLGEEIMTKFWLVIALIAIAVATFFVGPLFADFLQFTILLPYGVFLLAGFTLIFCACSIYVSLRCRQLCCEEDDDLF